MNIWRSALRRWRDDRGQSLVIVALAFVVLCGMVGLTFDIGNGYMQKQNLQAAVDAGALAGAQYAATDPSAAVCTSSSQQGQSNGTPSSDACSQATTAAQKNVNSASYTIVGNSQHEVTVSGTETLPTFFVRILGINNLNIKTTATAKYGPVGATYGFPVGVTSSQLSKDKQSQQTDSKTPVPITGKGFLGAPDLHGYLDFGSKGGALLRQEFATGKTIDLALLTAGQSTVVADDGTKSGPVDQGLQAALDAAHSEGLPGVYVVVPILSDSPISDHGPDSQTFKVLGFARFLVTNYSTGSDKNIMGYFVNGLTSGQVNDGAPDYGASAVQLIR